MKWLIFNFHVLGEAVSRETSAQRRINLDGVDDQSYYTSSKQDLGTL